MSGELQGKRILITGGTSGIGRQICLNCARQGARIAFCGMPENEDPAIMRDLRDAGYEFFFRAFDLTDLEATRAFARDAIAHLGGLDGLVNNAGANFRSELASVNSEEVRRCFYTNVYPAWALCQECRPALIEAGWGMIVNISSINATKSTPKFFPYTSAKAAVEGLTRAIAIEWGPDNIQAVAIAPAYIMTPEVRERLLVERSDFAQLEERIRDTYPLQRIGLASDVSSVVVYLLGGQCQFISGTTIPVDGGVGVQMLPEKRI